MIFETHAHFDDRRFKDDRDEILNSLKDFNIGNVINIGADMKSSKRSIDLAKKYDFIYASVGVHPHSAKDLNDDEFLRLKEMAKHKKVVAIGEIGLDFYYNYSEKDIQRFWFKKQMEFANEINLPVIIHSRDADQETFDMIMQADIKKKGVIHCYSGSAEMAKEYVKKGYYIGVGGVVTFPSAKKLVETVEKIPIEYILLETDCPYMAPVPKRGERNDSRYLEYISIKVSEIKKMSTSEVIEKTEENAKRLFLNHK